MHDNVSIHAHSYQHTLSNSYLYGLSLTRIRHDLSTTLFNIFEFQIHYHT
ncbi:hypothetical protein Hanom_Chr11g00981831 [Helianthus anomalus]